VFVNILSRFLNYSSSVRLCVLRCVSRTRIGGGEETRSVKKRCSYFLLSNSIERSIAGTEPGKLIVRSSSLRLFRLSSFRPTYPLTYFVICNSYISFNQTHVFINRYVLQS
jgi:hypothetical protein